METATAAAIEARYGHEGAASCIRFPLCAIAPSLATDSAPSHYHMCGCATAAPRVKTPVIVVATATAMNEAH